MDLIAALPGGGLAFAGHIAVRQDALDAARAWLISQQVDPWDIDIMLMDRPGLLARAWWAGPDVGFCSEQYPGAQPVTVVNLPDLTRTGEQDT